ncbi:MAG TPA: iron uptake system protein EfeO [Solirubrobacterales bacterium]|nr:iron uptake system protein EfeO [Solirubrobacterales bacterium]
MAQYRDYLEKNTAALVVATKPFVEAVRSGEVDEAKALYAAGRIPYERIEPVAESFGGLDPRIDVRANDVPASEFGGFHRIEKALWVDNTTAGMAPVAEQLQADVEELQRKVKSVDLQAVQIANGANELLGEVSASKITGEEERYSHIDLVDFEANVEGAEAAFDAVEPLLSAKDPQLAEDIAAHFADLYAALEPYRRGSGFVPYTELTKTDTRKLAQEIDALAELLSQVPGRSSPNRPREQRPAKGRCSESAARAPRGESLEDHLDRRAVLAVAGGFARLLKLRGESPDLCPEAAHVARRPGEVFRADLDPRPARRAPRAEGEAARGTRQRSASSQQRHLRLARGIANGLAGVFGFLLDRVARGIEARASVRGRPCATRWRCRSVPAPRFRRGRLPRFARRAPRTGFLFRCHCLSLLVPAQLPLALAGALLVELRLDPGSLGPLLGDRGLGAPLFRLRAMVTRVVVLRLGLGLAQLTAPAGARRGRDDDCQHDQGADDDGDDCKGGHRCSFGLRFPPNCSPTARCRAIETCGRQRVPSCGGAPRPPGRRTLPHASRRRSA